MSLNLIEASFVGTVLEGIFYGLYCIIFVLYIRIQRSKKCDDRTILIYPISSLFVLCTAFFALDFAQEYLTVTRRLGNSLLVWNVNLVTSLIYAVIDVVAQGVLIYRCWVVWNRRLAVIVVPSILALTSLAASLTMVSEMAVHGPQIFNNLPGWFIPTAVLSFSLSLSVNAIFTGLLVYKIAKASLALRRRTHTRGIQDVTPLISMLIESGLVLFIAQLLWVIFFSSKFSLNDRLFNLFNLTAGSVTMIYGIVPTTIVVRVAMANTTRNKSSTVTVPVESIMEFASTDDNQISTKRISSRGEPKETIV